jgi:type IV secretory pathway VirB2 component (pilin)
MSKSKKVFLRVIPIMLVLMVVVSTNVFGFSSFTADMSIDTTGATIDAADSAVKRIWSTVCLILQILAVAAIVIAGVRYMFASADQKADIKKQSVGLIVGAILVFAASTVVNFIVTVTSQVTTGK